MEERMRSIELEMKHVQGEELEQLMNTYTRLTHEFELENGYAYKSELTGILKGLGFGEEDFELSLIHISPMLFPVSRLISPIWGGRIT